MTNESVIHVNLAPEPYDIVIAQGLIGSLGRHVAPRGAAPTAILIFDNNVEPYLLGPVVANLEAAGFERIVRCRMSASEEHKSMVTINRLYGEILSQKVDRATPLIALGGGVVGDTAGFVAATVLRGLHFIQMPTTLLAMVDASVGGKVGVNHAVGKNLIGAFKQPSLVLIDPLALKTLPVRELRSGLAECIKHDLIRDAEGFTRLENQIDRATKLDIDYLTDLVAHNVAIKARVVEADPFERGERAHLNFGHTFGHAIETAMEYRYTHGECVALGMMAATFAAVRLGMFSDAERKRVLAVIEKAGLPSTAPELPVDDVIDRMSFDKKVRAGKVRFVLPDRIGHVVVRDDVPVDVVREAVESLRG